MVVLEPRMIGAIVEALTSRLAGEIDIADEPDSPTVADYEAALEWADETDNFHGGVVAALEEVVRLHDKPLPIDQHRDPEKLWIIMYLMAEVARKALAKARA